MIAFFPRTAYIIPKNKTDYCLQNLFFCLQAPRG